jgi:hypothetical protein
MQFNLAIKTTHKHTHLQAAQSRNTNQSLQKSVLLANAGQTAEKGAAGNKVLPKAGVTGFYDTFVLNRTFVFQINSSAERPRLRQYPNRYLQPYGDSAYQ